MNRTLEQVKFAARSRPIIAGLMLGLFLFVLALAHFEALHLAVHADACCPEHHCVVTMLATGHFIMADGAVTLELPAAVITSVELPMPPLFAAVDYSLLPSRGPPAAS